MAKVNSYYPKKEEDKELVSIKTEETKELVSIKTEDQPATNNNTTAPEVTTTMNDVKLITIKFEKPAHIKFIMQNTGEESPRILHDQKIALSRGTIYKLPITDESLELQNSYVIRPAAKFADTIRILNVRGGFVTVEPVIHGVVLNHNDEIGCLI